MAGIDNKKLMGLLIIAEVGLLLSQELIKERRKRRKWMCPWIRKRDGKGAYYSIINDLRRFCKVPTNKYIGSYSYTFNLFN